MKIVIDIPEEIKQKRDAGKVLSSMEIAMVCMAIKNGTPLPKTPKTPCDLCAYNPPSSADGKPCSMCPAVGKE